MQTIKRWTWAACGGWLLAKVCERGLGCGLVWTPALSVMHSEQLTCAQCSMFVFHFTCILVGLFCC